MRFALMIEPQQGLTYGQQVAIAKRAEANGFETLFRSDHYASFPGPGGMPTTDAWTVLAGLARDTDRIGLGALVSPVTFRHPGTFAKVVTTVDEMSGGRIEVGVGRRLERPRAQPARAGLPADRGAGRPAGGPAGDPARAVGRAGRLVVRRQGRVDPRRGLPSEAGRGPEPTDRAERRRPPQDHLRRRWVAARSAPRRALCGRAEPVIEGSGRSPQAIFARLDEACRAIGRDPATITRSAMVGTLIGATEADVRARETALLAAFGDDIEDGEGWIEERRKRWIVGTPGSRPRPGARLRRRRRRAPDAPGLHPVGPRPHRRDG